MVRQNLSVAILGVLPLLAADPGQLFALESGVSGPGYALDNGDTNGDLSRDLSDAVHLLIYLYGGGPPPVPLALCGTREPSGVNGDTNGNAYIDISDPAYLLTWLFAHGAEPVAACGQVAGGGGVAGVQQIPRVVPSNAKPYGMSYGEWSGAWWNWALGFPTPVNPLLDTTGEFCGSGQDAPPWYLAGTATSPTERTCTVPVGRALFFPVLNVVAWAPDDIPFAEFLGFTGTDEEKLAGLVQLIIDQTDKLEVTVDGVAVQPFRVLSPGFALNFIEDNVFGAPPGLRETAVSDGYWLMLPPLPRGEHTIRFDTSFSCTEATCGFDFATVQDVTYTLTVE